MVILQTIGIYLWCELLGYFSVPNPNNEPENNDKEVANRVRDISVFETFSYTICLSGRVGKLFTFAANENPKIIKNHNFIYVKH